MVRKSWWVSAKQAKKVESLAKKDKVTESVIIRGIINLV